MPSRAARPSPQILRLSQQNSLSAGFPLPGLVLVSCLMVVDEIANRRLTVLMLWLTMATAAVFLYFIEPGKSAFLPSCPFRLLTGLTCPGCGTTRCLHQLLHGNLAAAFQLNPLLLLSLPFLLYALVRYTYGVMLGRPMRPNTLAPKYIYAIFGIVLFFWVFRNTPFYPFLS